MFLSKRRQEIGLTVDFDKPPILVKDAKKILRHQPVGKGKVDILPGHLHIREMPAGITYEEYIAQNQNAVFGDACILDALFAALTDKEGVLKDSAEKLLGNFSGQIFFFGTAFEAVYQGNPKTCFPFLNWQTHFPHLRYICPADHPVNYDVNCCACHIELPTALTS